jgi:hypothetical protein
MQDFVIHLRPEPDAVPSIIRLRQALKQFKRRYGFVAVSVAEVPTHDATAQPLPTPEKGNCGPGIDIPDEALNRGNQHE